MAQSPAHPEPATGLPQEAYVWQRSWGEPVLEAVREHGTNFARLVALAAEVTWREGQPEVVSVPVPWDAFAGVRSPVGVAVRIGPFRGPFAADDARTRWLVSLAKSVLSEAKGRISVSELQIDFDCAASKLDGYALWISAIRRQVAPVRVVITALPSWLESPSVQRLAQSADGYVLQVHSLERPSGPQAAFTLCNLRVVTNAVARAARLGVPFRVALPTYGYLVAFDENDKFVGLSAEGPTRNWPPGTQVREVRSEPAELAAMVRQWSTSRPESLRGIIWYRLPVRGDALNWSWATLARVMRGEAPRGRLRVESRQPRAGLFEFDLLNEGDDDFRGNPEFEVKWGAGQPLASDGLRGFEPSLVGSNAISFRRHAAVTLRPQERQMVGWLRLANEDKVQCELRSAKE